MCFPFNHNTTVRMLPGVFETAAFSRLIVFAPEKAQQDRATNPPGLKTCATTLGKAIGDCCSPPLQRRGFCTRSGN
jgi:hypothetical protein